MRFRITPARELRYIKLSGTWGPFDDSLLQPWSFYAGLTEAPDCGIQQSCRLLKYIWSSSSSINERSEPACCFDSEDLLNTENTYQNMSLQKQRRFGYRVRSSIWSSWAHLTAGLRLSYFFWITSCHFRPSRVKSYIGRMPSLQVGMTSHRTCLFWSILSSREGRYLHDRSQSYRWWQRNSHVSDLLGSIGS